MRIHDLFNNLVDTLAASQVKCIPYLKSELGHFNDSEMDVHTVHQIMQPTPIVTLHQIVCISHSPK